MAATQQPDFAVLANGLQMVQQEVALVPNMPQIVGINAIHQQMNAFLQQMNQNQQQNQQQMAAHQQQMATLQQQMNQNQQQNQEQMATLQQQMNQNQQQSRQQMAALQQQMNQMQQQMNQNHQQVVAAVGRVEAEYYPRRSLFSNGSPFYQSSASSNETLQCRNKPYSTSPLSWWHSLPRATTADPPRPGPPHSQRMRGICRYPRALTFARQSTG
ncbi:hypothetical protein BDD12DRAFT_342943 [Trichophaea hybrida]|nr:hypothetical protein BDD12DRAFT_342943 [Trichophaea hybrida]